MDDRKIMFHAVKLFGELRYAPAIDFLIAEVTNWKVGWIGLNWSPDQGEVPPLEDSNPFLAALADIGPPAAAPLVNEYMRLWKTGGPKAGSTVEYFLGRESILGSVLLEIQKRIVKANFVEAGRDEIAALHHLKRELLKQFE
jgi:hypothetical protein